MESILSVISLLIALIGVYAFFKLDSLKDLLIGQGEASLSTESKKTKDMNQQILLNEQELERLKNAISRKNIYGVEEGILNASITELSKRIQGKTGYIKHVLPLFIKTKRFYNNFLFLSIFTLSILFIVLSFLIIQTTINYSSQNEMKYKDYLFLILLAFAFISTIVMIFLSLLKKVGFEKEKHILCKKLRKDNPNIDKIYRCP